jgi:hypothetical protein
MAAAAKAASVSECIDLISSDDEPNTPPQSSSKRSRAEIPDVKDFSSKKANMGAQAPQKLLWRLTTVDGIDARFNEGAVTFRDLLSGDWNSAVLANCKWIMISFCAVCKPMLYVHAAQAPQSTREEHSQIQSFYSYRTRKLS